MDREKIAQIALKECHSLGVQYADVRVEKFEDENISVSDGSVEPIEQSISIGIGIRVLKDGGWGFASTDNLDEGSIKSKTKLAVEIAKASASINKAKIDLSELKAAKGEYVSPYEIDPFSIPLDKKIAFLMDIDSAIGSAGGEKINSRSSFAGFRKIDKYFASSDGANLRQIIIQTGGGLSLGDGQIPSGAI